MTTDIQLTEEQTQVIAQKREAWAQMGEAVYKSEFSLQASAQQALADLTLPVKVEDLPEAETRLKSLKSAQATISENRKQITSRFDDVASRLMLPEKSLTEPIKMLSEAIIGVKKVYEQEQAKVINRQRELADCEAHFKTERARIEALFQNRVQQFVSRIYTKALNDSIAVDTIDKYLSDCLALIGEDKFNDGVTPFLPQHITQEESFQVWKKHFPIDVQKYLSELEQQVRYKFSDYAIALANKEEAVRQQQEEDKRKADEAAAQQSKQAIAAKIEAASFTPQIEPVNTKALKKAFEVDMDESLNSALTIMAAFAANINLCLPHLKVTKWFSFTPKQAAGALARVKAEDNLFAPSGINFIEVDKL